MKTCLMSPRSYFKPVVIGSLLLSSLCQADPGTWKCDTSLSSKKGEEQTELLVTLDPLKERPFVTPGESVTLAETSDVKIILSVGMQNHLSFPTVGIFVLDKTFQGPEGARLGHATAEECSRVVTLQASAKDHFLANVSCFRQ